MLVVNVLVCAPVMVADSFVQMATDSFPLLLPASAANPFVEEVDTVKQLAGDMDTDPAANMGTSSAEVVIGVKRYIDRVGYKISGLEYQDWRPIPKAMPDSRTANYPDMTAVKRAIADKGSAVWFNIGWYAKTETPGEWLRVGGHWVTAVCYGSDTTGQPDPAAFLVVKPSGTNTRAATRSATPGATVNAGLKKPAASTRVSMSFLRES